MIDDVARAPLNEHAYDLVVGGMDLIIRNAMGFAFLCAAWQPLF